MSNGVRRAEGWIAGPYGSALGASWYRPVRPAGPAVLLVRGFGHEDDAAVHGVHHVARSLSAAGHPVVVLSLSGTGQSAGRLDADAPTRWVGEVRSVVAQLAARTPAGLVVGGYRAGALVALHALAGTTSVAEIGVVAWHLPTGGKRLVREMRIMNAAQRTLEPGTDTDGMVIGAHRYSAAFLSAVSRLGVPPELPTDARALVIDTARSGADGRLGLPLAHVGGDVRIVSEPADWLVTGADDAVTMPVDAAAACSRFLATFAGTSWPAGAIEDVGASIVPEWTDGRIEEQIRTFGDAGLTGVLTRPPARAGDGTALLLLSGHGPGDSFVALAREQAECGRAVLRYDLSGFGANDPRPGHAPGEIYSSAGRADVAAGVTELHRLGHEKVVVVGFCAGGWAALRGRYSTPPTEIVAINVELFARSRRWMRRPVQAEHAPTRWARRAARLWQRAVRRADVMPPARRWLRRVTAGGTSVRLVFDVDDPGHVHFRSFIARTLNLVPAGGDVTVRTFAALGHLTEGPDADAMFAYVASLVDGVAGVTTGPDDDDLEDVA